MGILSQRYARNNFADRVDFVSLTLRLVEVTDHRASQAASGERQRVSLRLGTRNEQLLRVVRRTKAISSAREVSLRKRSSRHMPDISKTRLAGRSEEHT